MSNHPNQEKPGPRRISGVWGDGRCGVVVLMNSFRAQKLPQVVITCAAACCGVAAPAVHAADTSADAGIVAPDEPDDDSFGAGVPSASEDSEARAIFQAWKRLDTGQIGRAHV